MNMTDKWTNYMTERIGDAVLRLKDIPAETTVAVPFRDYFKRTAEFLLSVKPDSDNELLYRDILPAHYDTSYANPEYAVSMLGEELGPVLSAVNAELRAMIPAVFEGDLEIQAILLELFLEVYFEFESEAAPARRSVRSIFSSYLRDYMPLFAERSIRDALDPEQSFAAGIVLNADLTDLNYLFRYGEYVTEDTRRTAGFLNSLDETVIEKMAAAFTEGYRLGFVHAGKPLAAKKTVQIVFPLGYERVIRKAAGLFENMGLKPTFARYSPFLITKSPNRYAGYTGAIPNLQFDYDHREDLALVMDDEFVSLRKRTQQEVYEAHRAQAAVHAGPAVLENFGAPPFVPAQHSHVLRMDKRETERYLEMRNALMMIRQRFIPEKERSFTIIDFPVPAIGERFEEIFEETIQVNTLDSEHYSRIQQKLIDALDRGHHVRILGRNGNCTDLTIALHELEDPEHQTIFENCVADVNIPVGEVFTSPKLYGTNGLLHVKKVFLEGYEFRELKIVLKNGMIEKSDCANFDDPEENRNYIEENILYHHPTLTIGEFAIGTNTTAYVMAKKYGIESLMPILIAEKTGPHFAMGDTCYSRDEDNPVFNPDGKEIIARDNEHTLIRKTDPSKAYYGCHTDITIPYDELGEIRVVTETGDDIIIMKDGRFVLPGTEELNVPLDDAGY